MNHKLPAGAPTYSVWGQVDAAEIIAPGIVRVHTSSHGGIVLSPERMAEMPEALRTTWSGNVGSYEEDCDWAKVAVRWPVLFPARSVRGAVRTILNGGDYMAGARAWLESDAGAPARAIVAAWETEHAGSWEAYCLGTMGASYSRIGDGAEIYLKSSSAPYFLTADEMAAAQAAEA